MITKIKGYLKTLCADITGLASSAIITDLTEEIGDMLPPYVVILSGDGGVTPIFERALDSRFKNREVYRKYSVTQPVTVAFGAEDEASATAWRETFLARLAKRMVDGDVFIEVSPEAIRQTDNVSAIRSHFAAAVEIAFSYMVYLSAEELAVMTVSLD